MQANRPFLISLKSDAAYEVLKKWEAVGVCCRLNGLGTGVAVVNTTWAEPGTSNPPPVPKDALDELGQWHDEILSHLRYWKETREHVERIWVKHRDKLQIARS